MSDIVDITSRIGPTFSVVTNLQKGVWSQEDTTSTRPTDSSHNWESLIHISSTTPLSSNSALYNNTGNVDENITTPINDDQEFLDKDLAFILTLCLIYSLQIPVTIFGIITNTLNIAIFRLSRLKDSVSITFVALSISDLSYCISYLVCNVLGLIGNVFKVQNSVKIGHFGLAHYLSHFIFYFQDTTVLITVFIAVQKCLCVSIPYHFKSFFTLKKTVTIIICLCLCIAITYVPLFAGMSWKATPYSYPNQTTVLIVFEPLYMRALSFWQYFNKIILPTCSLLVISVCLLVMRAELKKSVNFRNGGSTSSLGTKERKAITAVAIVLIIFFLSSLPAAALNYSTLIASSFFYHPRNQTFYYFLTHSHSLLIQISASVNIFVYLKYNRSYKKTALALFHRRHLGQQSEDGKSGPSGSRSTSGC